MYCLVNIPEYILNEYYIENRPLPEVGENTGNCVFWESTKQLLWQQNLKLLSMEEYKRNPDFYKENVSKVVLSVANLIDNYNDGCSDPHWILRMKDIVRHYLHILSPLKCKKYMISIGAQCKDLNYFEFTAIQKREYVRLFSQFEVIYLRGKFTQGLLEHNQIPMNNVDCVGCPSLLLKPVDTNELNTKLAHIKKLKLSKVKIGISMGGMVKRTELERNFIRLMSDKTIHTLVQTDPQWVDFVKGSSPSPPIPRPKTKLKLLQYRFEKWKISKNIDNFIYSDNCLKLIDYFAKNVDFMVTTRIHGTVLGVLAGLPSLCLATDSRTYELCEQMGIPYINCIDKAPQWKNKRELVDLFLENCFFSEKLNQTVSNMRQKYAIFGDF